MNWGCDTYVRDTCACYTQHLRGMCASKITCIVHESLVGAGRYKSGEIVFSDICGEMPVLGYNQEKYFITFTDAASKTRFVEVLKNKKAETVLAAFKKVHNIMKNVFSHSITRLHTDNGSE
jgi:Integrase core domain